MSQGNEANIALIPSRHHPTPAAGVLFGAGGAGGVVDTRMPEDISEVIDASTNTVRDLDVQPYFTTSTWKASGFAGSVALRVKNVGAKRYWGEFPAVTFRVEVETFAGPEGVDRLITTTNYNGSHVRDGDPDRPPCRRHLAVQRPEGQLARRDRLRLRQAGPRHLLGLLCFASPLRISRAGCIPVQPAQFCVCFPAPPFARFQLLRAS
mgnify:CR=1 FL=1